MSLSYTFRVGKSTVSNILSDTLETIWKVLQPEVLKIPEEIDFREIANGFNRCWNYPNCIGAIDGKHVWIQVKSPLLNLFNSSNLLSPCIILENP